MATVGALIILLSLGFDPSVQQITTTPQRTLSLSANSTAVLRASVFDQSGMSPYNVVAGVETLRSSRNTQIYLVEIEAANTPNDTNFRLSGINPLTAISVVISNGANSATQIPEFTPSCPAANCTWPIFPSLGVCSSCQDVTNFARENYQCEDTETGKNNATRACTYSLPNSMFNYTYLTFNNTDGSYHEVDGELRQRVWSTILNTTTFSNNTCLLIGRMVLEDNGILLPSPKREQVHEATECALSMCAVNHNLAVEHGVTVYSAMSIEQPFTTELIPGPPRGGTTLYDVKPAGINGTTYTVESKNTLFFTCKCTSNRIRRQYNSRIHQYNKAWNCIQTRWRSRIIN
jgi:hypothetical protein